MAIPSEFTMIDASFGNLFNRIWRIKLCWGMIFTCVIHFFNFLPLFILINTPDVSHVSKLTFNDLEFYI